MCVCAVPIPRMVGLTGCPVGWPANAPLLVTDYSGDRILQLDPDTGIAYSLIDATKGFPLKRPYGVDIGPDGAVYVGVAGPKR